MDANSLQALASLLNPPEEENDELQELDVTPSPYATPGSIGDARNQNVQAPSKDIWTDDEVSENQHYDDNDDPRPQPEYDVIFKQAVGAEDVFLGTPKNPSTACCENLVVKIKLPDSDIKDIELDITDTYLYCRTPKCRLGLHLPHKVHGKRSKAKWISDMKELHITLLLDREYDFINN